MSPQQPMSTPPAVSAIIQEALGKTNSGQLEWTDRSDGLLSSFSAATPSGSMYLDSVDRDGAPPYRFRIFNNDGYVVAEVYTGYGDFQIDQQLPTLFQAVRNHFTRSDETLNGLLRDLRGY